MENYTEALKKINIILEKCGKNECSSCRSFSEGCCTFGCVNERCGGGYKFSNLKVTSPDYSCENFVPLFDLNESTLDSLRDLKADMERVNEGVSNLNLLLTGKITEDDFNDIFK